MRADNVVQSKFRIRQMACVTVVTCGPTNKPFEQDMLLSGPDEAKLLGRQVQDRRESVEAYERGKDALYKEGRQAEV